MTPDDLRLLESVGHETEITAGHVLIERGQHGTGLYVILEGTVRVEAPEGTLDLGAGTCVGERALLSADGKRTARVLATSNCRLLAVERGEFDRLCGDDPGLAQRVAP